MYILRFNTAFVEDFTPPNGPGSGKEGLAEKVFMLKIALGNLKNFTTILNKTTNKQTCYS